MDQVGSGKGYDMKTYGKNNWKHITALLTVLVMIRGQGDISDTYGLAEEDVITLVNAIQ